jgi:hypothetical protein
LHDRIFAEQVRFTRTAAAPRCEFGYASSSGAGFAASARFRRRPVSSNVSRMRASAIFSFLVMILTGIGCSHLQPTHVKPAVIEFERQEDNGLVNIVPCTLVLSDHQRITLNGGERAAVWVSPGSVYVTASSEDPYSSHSDATAWRSPRTRFRVASDQKVRVLVEPAASGSTYTGGWIIRAANKPGCTEPGDCAFVSTRSPLSPGQ